MFQSKPLTFFLVWYELFLFVRYPFIVLIERILVYSEQPILLVIILSLVVSYHRCFPCNELPFQFLHCLFFRPFFSNILLRVQCFICSFDLILDFSLRSSTERSSRVYLALYSNSVTLYVSFLSTVDIFPCHSNYISFSSSQHPHYLIQKILLASVKMFRRCLFLWCIT